MKKVVLASVISVFCLSLTFNASGQLDRKKIKHNNKLIANFRGQKSGFGKFRQYHSAGISISALNYYGDLAPQPSRFSTDISFTRPAIGLYWNYRMGSRISVQTQFMFGTLRASDNSADQGDSDNGVFRNKRNLSFRNNIKELSAVGVIDLFANQSTYISRVHFTPYVYFGVAGVLHNPQAQAPETDLSGNPLPEAGEWVDLRPLGTEGQYATLAATDANAGIEPYKTLQLAIPFGLGIRLRLTEVLDASFDIGFRYTFTDYLDDVSRSYVDLGVLQSDLARALSYRTGEKGAPSNPYSYVGRNGTTYTVEAGYGSEGKDNWRGNEDDNDLYMVTSIRLSYILGATFHKAKFR
jgi:hypothetical protein